MMNNLKNTINKNNYKMAKKNKSIFSGIKGGKNNMNKSMIVDFVAGKTKQTKKNTKETIDVLFDVINQVTKAGGYITFKGFGTFKEVKRKASTRKLSAKQKKMLGTNNSTMRVPASKRLTFSASKNK